MAKNNNIKDYFTNLKKVLVEKGITDNIFPYQFGDKIRSLKKKPEKMLLTINSSLSDILQDIADAIRECLDLQDSTKIEAQDYYSKISLISREARGRIVGKHYNARILYTAFYDDYSIQEMLPGMGTWELSSQIDEYIIVANQFSDEPCGDEYIGNIVSEGLEKIETGKWKIVSESFYLYFEEYGDYYIENNTEHYTMYVSYSTEENGEYNSFFEPLYPGDKWRLGNEFKGVQIEPNSIEDYYGNDIPYSYAGLQIDTIGNLTEATEYYFYPATEYDSYSGKIIINEQPVSGNSIAVTLQDIVVEVRDTDGMVYIIGQDSSEGQEPSWEGPLWLGEELTIITNEMTEAPYNTCLIFQDQREDGKWISKVAVLGKLDILYV